MAAGHLIDTGIGLVAIPLALLPVGLWVGHKFLLELRHHHPAEWERLGRLTVLTPMSGQQERSWIVFLLRRRYAKLGNHRLTRLGDLFSLWILVSSAPLIIWMFVGQQIGIGRFVPF